MRAVLHEPGSSEQSTPLYMRDGPNTPQEIRTTLKCCLVNSQLTQKMVNAPHAHSQSSVLALSSDIVHSCAQGGAAKVLHSTSVVLLSWELCKTLCMYIYLYF